MARDNVIEFFLFVCEKPNACMQCATFSSVSAFIDGYDMALQGGALVGFREWLLTGGNDWTNLPWWSLVRLRLNPESDLSSPPSKQDDAALIGELRMALEGFLRTQRAGGLAKVYHDYNTWLLSRNDDATRPLDNTCGWM